MPAITIVYALAGAAYGLDLDLGPGATAGEALAALRAAYPELGIPEGAPLGVYGQPVAGGTVLAAGDRVEVYRPLAEDPKDARRRRARAGGPRRGRR